jgi:homoserine O-succinyltransferase
MPVLINPSCAEHHLFARGMNKVAKVAGGDTNRDCINIGLINNMPDSALVPTERQVFDLLSAAAGKLVIKLHLYTINTTPRTDWGRDYVRRFYRGTDDLFDSRLDGIILTGAEPKTERLTDEPYWASFVQVIDWATENTFSSVFSCLAVHGAVLHLDGIGRHPLAEKCIGIFDQVKTMDHPLMLGVPERLRIPHSRWNEVREDALVQNGYTVLTKSASAGVDCFVKQHLRSLFVYFQGHPEYGAESLLGEYRRDVGRFLRREHDSYPTMPQGYFSRASEEVLLAFQFEALSDRRPELLSNFPVDRLAGDVKNTWAAAAERIYRNWIVYLSSQKARRYPSLTAGGFSGRRPEDSLAAATVARHKPRGLDGIEQ